MTCPVKGCGHSARRKNIANHLATAQPGHGYTRPAANEAARELPGVPDSTPALPRSAVPAVVESRQLVGVETRRKSGRTADSPFKLIEPTDIALSVIESQVNGSIPTALLSDIVLYVDHTRELVGKLRADHG